MFGALVRAAPTGALAALLGGILAYILAPLIEVIAVEAPADSLLLTSLQGIQEHAIFVMAGSVLLGVVYRAVVESRVNY